MLAQAAQLHLAWGWAIGISQKKFKVHNKFTIDNYLQKDLTVYHSVTQKILKQNEMGTVCLFDLQDLKSVCFKISFVKAKTNSWS